MEYNNSTIKDFFTLLKPRVMSLSIFTAICGIMLAPSKVNFFIGLISILCIAVGAGAAGAINMWYERDLDVLMDRTKNRPLPKKNIFPDDALHFGIFLSFFSVILLGLTANFLSAFLLGFCIFFYIIIYTIWLKKRTPQNIVIGGAAGAIPPLIGWTVVENNLSFFPLILFLIIFFWTPPHFWSLSLFLNKDYERAKIPMLVLVKGKEYTKINIVIYSLILAIISVIPYFFGYASKYYLAVSVVLGIKFLIYSVQLVKNDDKARPFFNYSIIYLFILFLCLTLDKVVN